MPELKSFVNQLVPLFMSGSKVDTMNFHFSGAHKTQFPFLPEVWLMGNENENFSAFFKCLKVCDSIPRNVSKSILLQTCRRLSKDSKHLT